MKYSKNKATLVNTLVTVGVLVFTIFCIWGTSKLDSVYCILAMIIFECFACIPAFNYYYYKMYDTEMGWKKIANFIPFFNYTISLNPWISRLGYVLFGAFLFVAILMFFPNAFTLVFSDNTIFGLADKVPVVMFIILSLFFIDVGIGLFQCSKDVDKYYSAAMGEDKVSRTVLAKIINAVPALSVILMCLPLLKIIPLTMSLDKLMVLSRLNMTVTNIELNDSNYDDEDDEEE